ncbi:MAG: iron donor protein CyaY [Gallionella sp.]
MTELEFTQRADATLARIEAILEQRDDDVDFQRSGNVLEIELENGAKLILNRHDANQEIWLAAKSGGFHYAWQNDQWFSQRDGSELFTRLTELLGD